MPQLILGPLLRQVGERDATVWVETDAPCKVEVATIRIDGRRADLRIEKAVPGPGLETTVEQRLS